MKSKTPNHLYFLINTDTGTPFYVGITNNPERRMKEHEKDYRIKKCSKFKDVVNFHMIVVMKNTNKKFNIKLIETFFIIYDRILGDKLLKNQYIY